MTSTDLPTRPDGPLVLLAESYAINMHALHGPDAKGHALAALADGTAITQYIDADRWPTAVAALTADADLADVAEAMGLDSDGVRIGLVMWAVDQCRGGLMSQVRYEEIIALTCIGART